MSGKHARVIRRTVRKQKRVIYDQLAKDLKSEPFWNRLRFAFKVITKRF